jgi:PAS domain S-box-containing protein
VLHPGSAVNRLPLRALPAALLALLSTAVTLAVRLALDGPLGGRPTLVIFTVPIMLSAYGGGLRAGLLATALSFVFACYFLLPPLHDFAVESPVDLWQLWCVVLAGVVISVLNEALHRARRRADAAVLAQVQAASALLSAGALQNAIFNSADLCSIATDAQGLIRVFNVGAERLFGYTADEAVNRLTPAHLSDKQEMAARAQALSEEFGTPITPGLQALTYKASRGLAYVYEPTLIRKDGSRFPAVVSVAALRDPAGTILGYLLLATDDSLRQQADEARRETDALLRTIHLHSIVSVTDLTGRIVEVNDNFCAISGYRREELLGQTHRVVNSGVQQHAFWVGMWRSITAGEPWRGEICNRTKAGALYWVDSTIVPFVGADGQATKYVSIRTDITAARLAAARVAASEALLDRSGRIAGVGGWEYEVQTRSLTWTAQNYRIHELAPSHAPTLEEDVSYFPAEARATKQRVLAAALSDGTGWDLELPFVTAAGRALWVRTVGSVEQRDGKAVRVFGVLQDITARKQVEASLRDAIHKAEAANRAKSDFLANTSHEIRTPMNAVMGLSYLLGQTTLDAPQRTLLAKVELASTSLLGVLNNVLDLAKIEADELIVERAPFSLHRLLQALDDLMALQAKAKAIAFEIDVEPGLPAVLEGDATRLAQVLTNLLSNAIKFTDRGRVGLRVRRLAATAPQVRLCFEVQDSGIGIAADVQARLFEPFVQADASITRRFGGTGLGLSIVRHLVQLMGGEVRLQSWAGVGSEFTVTLDFADVTALSPVSTAALNPLQAAPRPADGRALAGVRVLVVDDSDINLEVTQRILQLAGARVGLAASGEQALGLLRGHPDAFDIVLMDVQMPGLDGHDATRRIRGELALTALPVIALTAGALSSERQKALDAGMDDYIVKPFEAEALVRTVLRHVQRAEGVAPAAVEAANESPNESPNEAANEAANGAASDALPPALPWQEIDGVDAADARLRFGGDFVLFCSLLKRMLAEFAGAALVVPQPASTSERAWLGGRLHKLRGVAGLLGATSVQEAAERAEAACATAAAGAAGASGAAGALGDADPAPTLLAALAVLAEQLQRLQRDAAPALAAAEAAAEAAAQLALRHGSGGLTPQALRDFMSLLRTQSLSALDRFGELTPLLTRQLGADRFQTLRTHMEVLQFSEAAELLAHDGSDAA